MAATLMIGVAEKAAGDNNLRLACDFGNEPLLQQGYTITAQSISCADSSPPTIAGVQLDANGYSVSGKFSGGTAGTTYTISFSITLDDPDLTVLVRKGSLKVI